MPNHLLVSINIDAKVIKSSIILGEFKNNLYLCKHFRSGLTGFDSGLEWYVSTQSVDDWLLNLSCQKLIGENNYALAA